MGEQKREMQRLAGKFAFLLAGVYLIILFAAVVSTGGLASFRVEPDARRMRQATQRDPRAMRETGGTTQPTRDA